jgi:hypothetical protein
MYTIKSEIFYLKKKKKKKKVKYFSWGLRKACRVELCRGVLTCKFASCDCAVLALFLPHAP